MTVDYLLIGQGIAGTFLSWEMARAGCSFLVMDEIRRNSASRVASGVINPITGRRMVKTWMIDELLPYSKEAYTALGKDLQVTAISQKNIIDFFRTPQMKLAFEERYQSDPDYLSIPQDQEIWRPYINYPFGFGEIVPGYLIHLSDILPIWRKRLQERQQLIEEQFDINTLKIKDDGIEYNGINASVIIFCDGVSSFNNPYFSLLPFASNKGEAMLVRIPDLPSTHILKMGYTLVPWQEDVFWLGANYLWEFDDDQPSEAFRASVEKWLQQTVKLPYTVEDHMASLRPATLERRPFVGIHPMHSSIGIFNGMGTKGCSLSPWFAREFVEYLLYKKPLTGVADVQRFRRILLKK